MSRLSKIRNKILSSITGYNQYKYDHICWFKTILYNSLWFGAKGLLKLPIHIYNNVDIISSGRITIDGEIHTGMIKMGIWKAKAHNHFRLVNYGTIIFHGKAVLQGGCIIENYGGIIEFGNFNKISESCKLMCRRRIVFQDHISVGYETTFMDTDFHFIVNTTDRKVHLNEKEINIGEGVWISSNCKIMKGVCLPANSIVCANSLLLKDFSYCRCATVFAGSPAKVINEGKRRIFNIKKEQELLSIFQRNNTLNELQIPENDLDKLCFENFNNL